MSKRKEKEHEETYRIRRPRGRGRTDLDSRRVDHGLHGEGPGRAIRPGTLEIGGVVLRHGRHPPRLGPLRNHILRFRRCPPEDDPASRHGLERRVRHDGGAGRLRAPRRREGLEVRKEDRMPSLFGFFVPPVKGKKEEKEAKSVPAKKATVVVEKKKAFPTYVP